MQAATFVDHSVQANGTTGATANVNVTVKDSTFNYAAVLGNGGISLNPFGGINFRADIHGNTFNDIRRPVTNLGAIGMTSGLSANADVTISNNTINDIDGARGTTATIDGGTTEMLINNSFPPKGWALCNVQLLTINRNHALFSLLGTTFGNGRVIQNNAITNWGNAEIHLQNNDGSATVNASVFGNSVTYPTEYKPHRAQVSRPST